MIEPATMIGITGIVFESPEKLKKELIRIGVITDDK